MNGPRLIYSFRARLLAVLAILLIVTLSVQYYLNLRTARESLRLIDEQEVALMVGVALGWKSLTSKDYLIDLRKLANDPLLDERAGHIKNILVVDKDWRVIDSLDPNFNPATLPDGSIRYQHLKDIPLPPLINADQLTGDKTKIPRFPNITTQWRPGEPRAFMFVADVVRVEGAERLGDPRKEFQEEQRYVIVALGSPHAPSPLAAARPLIYTLIVLLIATTSAAVLVWRFTRPIKGLSRAAQRVAAGDLSFRVPAGERRDEMGVLTAGFNEMIGKLEHTRELEAQLHQAEQSAVVGRLASAIAHEIRNPLNYITLTLDHLRTTLSPADPTKRETFYYLADKIKSEVARINERVSEFLNYTRPSKLDLRPVDLLEAVEDALRIVEVQAAESGIETRVEVVGEVPCILADADSMHSMLSNLIINGLQAIDSGGGRLSIKLSSDETRTARIEIADSGQGIPAENVSKVFEPYFSTKETGTGLGLAIVKRVVDDHRGEIKIDSVEGRGTTFTITLPAMNETQDDKTDLTAIS